MAAANSHLNSMEKVQNQALRISTGSMRSTHIEKMQTITGVAPLQRNDGKQRHDCDNQGKGYEGQSYA